MKPTTSKIKYTWNQSPASENIHETNYQQDKIYMKPNYQQEKIYIKPITSKIKYTLYQLPARENIH